MMGAFSSRVKRQAQQLVVDATARGLTCGCAESCTGGLISGAITSIAGSSAVLRGGIVSYDPQVKHDVLGVGTDIIEDPERGVVSRDCAEQMAIGARRGLTCDIAVSVTGIAGPGGAEPNKPVGTVWFGLATPEEVSSECKLFAGSRDEVREQAVLHALELLHEATMKISR